MVSTQEQFEQVQAVKKSINTASEEVKNQALLAMADHLLAATEEILAANALDMEAAKGKISDVMLDRLYLDAGRIVSNGNLVFVKWLLYQIQSVKF